MKFKKINESMDELHGDYEFAKNNYYNVIPNGDFDRDIFEFMKTHENPIYRKVLWNRFILWASKFYEGYNSPNGFRVLTEKNLNRISKGHEKDGYVIISASRFFEDMTKEQRESENNKRTNELKRALKNYGYSYLAVYGGYREEGASEASMEKSFVVYPYNIVSHSKYNFEDFLDDMKELGKKYDQDSILVCEPGGKPHYVALKPGVDEFGFDSVRDNDMNSEYFTAIKKWNDSSLNRKGRTFTSGKPQRYTLECYIKDAPKSRNEGYCRWSSHDMNSIYMEE